MKRFFALILTTILTVLALCACGTEEATNATPIKIAALKGPTSIGLVKLMEDNETGAAKNKYEFTLSGSADEVTPKLLQGELDMAAVPANLASVLYNNSNGEIKVVAVNTLGVIYIVERGDSIHEVSDLKGKTIYGSGKGSTPEFCLRYILKENGLDPDKDVNIEWKSEHTEVVQSLAANEGSIGLLPQPFVTVAKGQIEGLNVALDLTEEWDKISTDSSMITGVLVARRAFVEEHKKELEIFLKEYAESVDYVNNNVEDAAALTEKNDIIKAAVAEKAIPYCNIVCITGTEMKDMLEGYLKVLYEAEPKAIGGTLPGEDFY